MYGRKSRRIAELEAEVAALRGSIEAGNAYWRAAESDARKASEATEFALKDCVRELLPLVEDFDRLVEVALASVDRGGYQLYGAATFVLEACKEDVYEAFPYEYHSGLFDCLHPSELLGYLEQAKLGVKIACSVMPTWHVRNVYRIDKGSAEYLDYRSKLERRYRRALTGYNWMIEDEEEPES